jgi:hypothetical protein
MTTEFSVVMRYITHGRLLVDDAKRRGVQDSTDNRVDEIDGLERLGFVDLFFFFFLVVTYLVDRVGGGEIGWLGVGGGRWGRMKNEELIPNGTDEESTATVSIPVASSKCVPASLSFSLSLC